MEDLEESYEKKLRELIEELNGEGDCSLDQYYRVLLVMRQTLDEHLDCAEGDGVDLSAL